MEYYLKWQGISLLKPEPDGVAVSDGIMFWFIPYTAFDSPEDGRAFIGDVYGRLSQEAKSLSEKRVQAVWIAAERKS
jgi:hypothetical protein